LIDLYNSYRYWKYSPGIDSETCDRILDLATDKWGEASTGAASGYSEKRKSDVVFAREQWLYDIVFDYMWEANASSGWNIQIDAAEDMQITRYTEGGFYDFHFDGTGLNRWNAPQAPLIHNKARKLSMTIVLNDDYEGGEFEFMDEPDLIKEKKGTIIVFPSYMMHRVRPVTQGVRHSLVTWFVGEPFR
jgi:PKHD-type hydroxylase